MVKYLQLNIGWKGFANYFIYILHNITGIGVILFYFLKCGLCYYLHLTLVFVNCLEFGIWFIYDNYVFQICIQVININHVAKYQQKLAFSQMLAAAS